MAVAVNALLVCLPLVPHSLDLTEYFQDNTLQISSLLECLEIKIYASEACLKYVKVQGILILYHEYLNEEMCRVVACRLNTMNIGMNSNSIIALFANQKNWHPLMVYLFPLPPICLIFYLYPQAKMGRFPPATVRRLPIHLLKDLGVLMNPFSAALTLMQYSLCNRQSCRQKRRGDGPGQREKY